MGREMQTFVPIEKGKIGLYCCGPTVYDYAHIGNLRTYVFEDVLRKTLEYFGYQVRHVMNVTDVGHLTDDADNGEDKMLKGARNTGKTVWEVAQFYTDAFFHDVGALRCIQPTVVCKATDHIQDMIALIQRLEKNGLTYVAGGNVYFDTSKFPGYGKLALLDRQDLLAGARIAVDAEKRNPADFALWFTKGKFEHQAMVWDSPWGRGYPGWHIECSAMSIKYLGEHFDIHCGGVDHIPIHSTNEIAQSEGATGKKWVNYWMHGEFLTMGAAKMAKSAGGFITLSTVLERGYDPLDYRYFLLGAHYRTQLAFSWEGMDSAKAGRQGLVERIAQLRSQSEPSAVLEGKAQEYLQAFDAHLADDLNMPRCLADLWTMLRDTDVAPAQKLAAALKMDTILDLGLREAREAEQELSSEVLRLVEERELARKSRNWKRADEIRETLKAMGVVLQDEASGTKVRIATGKSQEKIVTSEGNSC